MYMYTCWVAVLLPGDRALWWARGKSVIHCLL